MNEYLNMRKVTKVFFVDESLNAICDGLELSYVPKVGEVVILEVSNFYSPLDDRSSLIFNSYTVSKIYSEIRAEIITIGDVQNVYHAVTVVLVSN